jgi:two-component system response regulator LytT
MKIAMLDSYYEGIVEYSKKIGMQLKKYNEEYSIDLYSNVKNLDKNITRYDVVFMGIQMPEMNGISYAESIRERGLDLIIVFLSDQDNYVWKCFNVNAAYFIRKKFFDQEIEDAIQRIIKLIKKKQDHAIFIQSGKQIIQFDLSEIIYIEAQRKKQRFVCVNRDVEVNSVFSKLQEELGEKGFLKTHRSYLVNYRNIFKLKPNSVITSNGVKLPVSRYVYEDIEKEYFKLIKMNHRINA